jgi:hypothetical protein
LSFATCADNLPASRLRPPDTSTVDRPYPNPFGCKPRGFGHAACLPARMDWGGKSGIVAPARASRAKPATRERLLPLWERKGKALGVPAQQTNGGDQPPSAAKRHKNGTLARRNADGRPARGPVGQRASGKARGKSACGSVLMNAAPSGALSAGQSASLNPPVHHSPLPIVTRMGRDCRPGSRQRIERGARRAAARILIPRGSAYAASNSSAN